MKTLQDLLLSSQITGFAPLNVILITNTLKTSVCKHVPWTSNSSNKQLSHSDLTSNKPVSVVIRSRPHTIWDKLFARTENQWYHFLCRKGCQQPIDYISYACLCSFHLYGRNEVHQSKHTITMAIAHNYYSFRIILAFFVIN